MFQKLAKVNPMGGSSSKSGAHLSVIGPDVRIVGDIFTQGEMQIDGQVEGDIACQKLVVGDGACIKGAVSAETVQVHGELHGRITATTVAIAKSAKVIGDITHQILEIEAGADVEGHIARNSGHADAVKGKAKGTALPAPAPAPAQDATPEDAKEDAEKKAEAPKAAAG